MIPIWLLLFLTFGVVYLFLYYLKFYIKWKNGPPGPIPIPVFGNILQMAHLQIFTNPSPAGPQVISLMSKKYKDIWRLRIGSTDFVVCSSISTINKIMGRGEAQGRDFSGVFYDRVNGVKSGIASTDGPLWERHRKLTFKHLNALGMRKRGGGNQSAIYAQLSPILNKFEEYSNLIELEINSIFLLSVTKVVFSFIMGSKIKEKEQEAQIEECVEASIKMARSNALTAGIGVAFPILRKIFPKMMGREQTVSVSKVVRKVAQKVLMDAREMKDEETLASLFLKEKEEHPDDPFLSDFHFGTIFFDLLQASSDTTSSYLQFLIFYSALYPSFQEKVYKEIVSTVGESQEIELEDKKKMPYTDAFMLESHRCGVIIPNFIPHRVTSEFKCEQTGFLIPKNANIMSDMFAANADERIWKNPDEFYPQRFIEDPKLKNEILPFGVGKRICPGEEIGESIAFIFFTNILRKYKISQVPDSKLNKNDVEVGISSQPKSFSVLISRR